MSGEGNEKVWETIQVLNGNCEGLGFVCLFCNLSLEKSSLSICLICWKTVVAVFYSKKSSLLYLNHKHLQVSVKATTLLLWCFGEFVSLEFLFHEIVSLTAIAFGVSYILISLSTSEIRESRLFNFCLVLISKWELLKENLFRIISPARMCLMERIFSRAEQTFWMLDFNAS